jgi:ketosteroid isomerase-like protein
MTGSSASGPRRADLRATPTTERGPGPVACLAMSREDLELVRRVYESWTQGDFSGGEAFHPDVEFEMVDWPESGRSRGLEAMRRTWISSLRAWDDFRAEPTEFVELGGHIVVLTHVEARGRGSAAQVSADTATLWTFEGGRVVRLALYWDAAEALEVAGRGEDG